MRRTCKALRPVALGCAAGIAVTPSLTAPPVLADASQRSQPAEDFAAPRHGSAAQATGRWFDRVFIVVFENKDRSDVIDVPYFAELARRGEQLPRFVGEVHPSQPNYLALVAGDTFVRDMTRTTSR